MARRTGPAGPRAGRSRGSPRACQGRRARRSVSASTAATMARPSALSSSPSSQPRRVSASDRVVPLGVVPSLGPAAATRGCCGRPRRRGRGRRRRRPPAAAAPRCARRRGAPAGWSGPATARGAVRPGSGTALFAAASGRPGRSTASAATRASDAASAASAEPGQSAPSTRRTAASTPPSRAPSAAAGVVASQMAGNAPRDERRREVVEGRGHDLRPDGPQRGGAEREVRLPEAGQPGRPARDAQLVGEVDQRVERLAERPQPAARVMRRIRLSRSSHAHALTLSGTPSHSRQRGSTEPVPRSRHAAPLGSAAGAAAPSPGRRASGRPWCGCSAGRRRRRCPTWRPPRLRGTTWSMLVAELPQ